MREPTSAAQAHARTHGRPVMPPCLHCGRPSRTGLHFACRRKYGAGGGGWRPMSLEGRKP